MMEKKKSFWYLWIIIPIALIVTCSVCIDTDTNSLPEYRLLESKNLDYSSVRRTQYNIEVATNTGDKEIKKILEEAVPELAKKREVDALVINLYLKDTEVAYAKATWAPEGDWGKAKRGNPKSIFKTSIEILTSWRPKESSNVKKFGLSLEQRKMIYREIGQSERRTNQISAQKYPDDFVKQAGYLRELDEKYKKEICDKYNIMQDVISSIIVEGLLNNWKMG